MSADTLVVYNTNMYIVMNHGFSRVNRYDVLGLLRSIVNSTPGIEVRSVMEREHAA